jgi:hypothetical protein
MSTLLKTSLFLNCLLAALLFWLAARPKSTGQVRASVAEAVPSVASGPPSAAALPPTDERPPADAPDLPTTGFNWRQVEAPEYRTYTANLRRIGCPEQTIRDIITADLHSIFAGKSTAARRNAQAGARGPSGFASPAEWLAAELKRLQDEEAATLYALLGPPPATEDTAPEAALVAQSDDSPSDLPQQDAQALVPLVFRDPGQDMNLDQAQLEVMDRLRMDFNNRMAGVEADPTDPAYLRQWQSAQSASDDMMSLLLGRDFQMRYRMRLRQLELAAAGEPW